MTTTGRRDDFLCAARAHKKVDPKKPIRVIRELGWQASLFTHDRAAQPTVVTASPSVLLTYITWRQSEKGLHEPVIFRELFGGVVAFASGAGSIEVVLQDSLHDWLIANANEVQHGMDGDYVRVYHDEDERELAFVVDYQTSLMQKI